MTIGTNALIEFFGTQVTLGTSSSAVVNDAFSVAGDLSTWTNTDDVPRASVTLSATFSSAPTEGSALNLFLRLVDVESTNDQEIPDANYGHVYAGSFPVNDVTSEQYQTIDISLPNGSTSQQYEFYLENKAGQTMSAGWDIYVTPKTYGPAA